MLRKVQSCLPKCKSFWKLHNPNIRVREVSNSLPYFFILYDNTVNMTDDIDIVVGKLKRSEVTARPKTNRSSYNENRAEMLRPIIDKLLAETQATVLERCTLS